METTGRFVLVLNRTRTAQALAALRDVAGHVADSRDFAPAAVAVETRDPLVFHNFGLAVVELDPDQFEKMRTVDDILAMEPEPIFYPAGSEDYWRGFQAGVEATVAASIRPVDAGGRGRSGTTPAVTFDERSVTWGLQTVGIGPETTRGKGIRVAVVDSGVDLSHPDLNHQPITCQSFVAGAPIDDFSGHGTHCAGTVGATVRPATGPRYGVAPEAQLCVARVFDNRGRASATAIIAALDWALDESCQVVSMSISAAAAPGERYLGAIERAASVALSDGVLIVAAAGNESRRPASVAPISHPANCPSIMAVAAVDDQMHVPFFSNGQAAESKEPDIAAPGVQIYSAWPMPRRTNTISGTSMATPHVAGVAALHAEITGERGAALWRRLLRTARPLSHASKDVGAGIVQAP